jgi:hypothetical protein
MMSRLMSSRGEGERGQSLVLFALMLVALLGFAALAIDVSRAYAAQRQYRAVADAASLAGAQDLQGATRIVVGNDRARARTHALEVLKDQLGATGDPVGAGCDDLSQNLSDCALPGTDYRVSINATNALCVLCDPTRSVQVTVRNPVFFMTFARVLGQTQWNVLSTSVAGLTFKSHYALITLRPPCPNKALDPCSDDIDANGTKTRLNIHAGDVGTNTDATTNSGARITLASGYYIDHIDTITPDPWWKDPVTGEPFGRIIGTYIQDPMYPYPTSYEKTFANQADGIDLTCSKAPKAPDPDAPPAGAVCYNPGIYQENFNVLGSAIAYLQTGTYLFAKGADIRGTLLGGVESSKPGVDLVVPQNQTFTANNAVAVWVNKGGVGCTTDACRALPARDADGNEMKTTDGLVVSMEVIRNGTCFSGTNPIGNCANNPLPNTLRMPGNGQLFVAGVIYAPSDNVTIAGDNSGQQGVVGQIISWTVKYSGGAVLNQTYPSVEELGILRLDAACTSPSTNAGCP